MPALIFAGVPPVAANATNTLALWPASASSAWAYRRELSAAKGWVAALGGASLIGGVAGGLLLMRTTDARFLSLLPWLLLAAAVTFSFGDRLQRAINRSRRGADAEPPPSRRDPPVSRPRSVWPFLAQLAIAIYGGYFGGGMGIMMLATLTIAGMSDIHQMNAVKSVLAVVINGVALAEFIALGAIAWAPGLVMVAGGIAGGYAGAATARRVDQRYVRGLVAVIAWGMTLYFFVR